MNKKQIISSALFFMILSGNVFASTCNKDKICQWQTGEKATSCSDCFKEVYPDIKFIKSDITAFPGKFIDFDDFAESNIKFSIRAINGNVYISSDPAYCGSTSTQSISVMLAETSYDSKAKIYLVPANQTVEFTCRTFFMPQYEGQHSAFLTKILWGINAKTAKQNEINAKNYSELSRFSTYPIKLSIGKTNNLISGYTGIILQQRIREWQNQLDLELKNISKKYKKV